MYFEDSIDDSKYCGHLFGLGSTSFFQNGIPFVDSYMTPQSLAAAAAAAGQQTPQHNSSSQSSLVTLGHGNNNHNSASTPNLTNLPGANGVPVSSNDPSKIIYI